MVSVPFFVAEAGVNHDGSIEKAMRLVDIAARAGADAVKFQTFTADDLASPDAPRAAYQERQLGAGSQHEMLRALELDPTEYRRLAEHCAGTGIEFMSTPFDPRALAMLLDLGMRRIKIPSGEITNLPLIRAAARTGKPLILSTGMADMAETARAVGWVRQVWHDLSHDGDLTVLHCTSNYPTAPEDANLRAMTTIASELDVAVGYSDHTIGSAVAVAACGLGATVIEKHFTEDASAPGPDHAASIEPAELAQLVEATRIAAIARGDGVKAPRPSERAVRAVVRRSAFARTDIAAGDTLDDTNIAFRRPEGEIGPEHADRLFDTQAARAIAAGEAIGWDAVRE